MGNKSTIFRIRARSGFFDLYGNFLIFAVNVPHFRIGRIIRGTLVSIIRICRNCRIPGKADLAERAGQDPHIRVGLFDTGTPHRKPINTEPPHIPPVNTSACQSKIPVVIIRAGNTWDGVSDAPLGSRDIRIEGGVIKEIAENIPAPEGAEVINLRDRMVLPGLIDCHVHLTLRPEISPTFWSHSGTYKGLLGAQALQILLMNGFTTVRDVGDMDLHGYTTRDLKIALAHGIIKGPRLITSGHMISCRGGHMDVTAALSPYCNAHENCLADGPDEIRTVVRNEIKWGADWIKYAASGGFATPSDDPVVVTYTQEEMDTLVATAAQLHRPVAAHIHGDDAVRMSVLAGVRSVEHGAMASKETLALIEEKGVYFVPTQYAGVRSARFADSEAYWDAMGATPEMRIKMRKYKDLLLETAHHIAKSNVRIAFGTDLGILSYTINGAKEFGEMVANGITPIRALRAATSVAAELLMQEDIGTLAPGKCADIVAVCGNPFEDITVMEHVNFVMKAGIVYKPA